MGSGTASVRVRKLDNTTIGAASATAPFQNALNAAAWGSANGGQGTVYVPSGVWTVGTPYLRSNLAPDLAPGAVLRYTGEDGHYDHHDGIDVMESTGVSVGNAVGIGLDDPFSTKTWDAATDLFRTVPGDPRPLDDVTFDGLLSWTYCYGLKAGQGFLQPQSNVTFTNATVYQAAVGIGDPAGSLPINGVTVKNVRVRDAGTTPARINGSPTGPINGVSLGHIVMPGTTTGATSLAAMKITGDTHHGPVTITP